VLTTVEFHDDFAFRAAKIYDVLSDRMLPAKFRVLQSAITEP